MRTYGPCIGCGHSAVTHTPEVKQEPELHLTPTGACNKCGCTHGTYASTKTVKRADLFGNVIDTKLTEAELNLGLKQGALL